MIGGNTKLALQAKTSVKNAIGEAVHAWETVQSITGWLDYQAGEAKYQSFNAKIQESTHIFLSDYVEIDARIKVETCRAVVDGQTYDVILIDDPMGRHRQLEIYLKYTGGQNG